MALQLYQHWNMRFKALFGLTIFFALLIFGNLCYATPEQDLLSKLQLARKEHKLISQTTILIELADLCIRNQEYPRAIEYYTLAHELAGQRKSNGDMVFTAAQIGNVYDTMGDLLSALKWYNSTLKLADSSTRAKQLSYIHNNIGNLYLKIGSFSKSLEHYQKALEIKQKLKDKPGIAKAMLNLGVFYLRTGNLDRTLELQSDALKLFQEIGDPSQIAMGLSSISVTYRQMQNYPKAFEYNRKALQLYQELNNPAKVASAYNNLGVLYLATDNLVKAKENYLKSLELKKDSRDLESILSTLTNLADISLKLKQMPEAQHYLEQANTIQAKTSFYELSRNLFKINSEYYEAVGKDKLALDYYKRYHTISDSLANVQKAKQMNELEVKYEVLEKEKNIELLTRNNKLSEQALLNSARLRNYLIIILGLILIIALILIWRIRSSIKLNKELRSSRESLSQLNRELEKRVLQEVNRRNQQEQKALQQSRLAVLGELAAGIAHELNQPMQTLSFTLENITLAIQEGELDAEYLKWKMRYLFEDIIRMQTVIEHIRCFSRQADDPALASFDLNVSVNSALNMVRDRFEHNGISFELSLAEGIPPVKGNQYKFEHVILNLLTNARDAIETITASDPAHKGRIEVFSKHENGAIMLAVKDNGCGIPEEDQEKVFDIFFTTKSIDKGTGLGLSISAGIIKGMNATLALSSQPGKGTCITISIPDKE